MSGLDFKFKPTPRGFSRADFKDLYGAPCSIQASSLATDDAIWLGCDELGIEPVSKEPFAQRMHLNREQVASLLPILERFVETGELSS